ncbi:MAG: twin-arginine translocation signal domain-containing protein [Thermoguttaceae bacterium]|nr:twin-arginine translocation signal domain-containing protein [Thermoguttaceae bacterium]MBQ6618530.1 twin-arginine translocation signal domain-containing protein [Thermoguttaceae bacterium]
MGSRRDFLKTSAAAIGACGVGAWAGNIGGAEELIGQTLPDWREGEMFLHFIYNGVGENMFYVFPDGTTMLLDTGERDIDQEEHFPVLPNKSRSASEWIARYVAAVKPKDSDRSIDYMMLSHYHNDHGGDDKHFQAKADGRGDYALSGLANMGEFFDFGAIYDRGNPNQPKFELSESYENHTKFAEWKVSQGVSTRPQFAVGALDQIHLTKKRESYPDFHIRNLAANIVVWSGKEGENDDLRLLIPEANVYENALSLAILISYGPFKYYTGGDISDCYNDPQGGSANVEGRVGTAAGEVDVCKTNHHTYKDAMRKEFTSAVRARFYITNVWDYYHLCDNTMANMTEGRTTDETTVCPTWVAPKRLAELADCPWHGYLQPAYGHVVVRVVDGGQRYFVYHLDATDERRRIKRVLGPFESKGK